MRPRLNASEKNGKGQFVNPDEPASMRPRLNASEKEYRARAKEQVPGFNEAEAQRLGKAGTPLIANGGGLVLQ